MMCLAMRACSLCIALLAACCNRPIGSGQDGATPRCGDGVAQPGEECDLSDLRGLSCQDLGFDSGSLGCSSACLLDTAACIPPGYCGDGMAQLEEDCDGEDYKGASCPTVEPWEGGTLLCTDDCQYDTTHCCRYGGCGDAVINCGEECDYDYQNQVPVLGGVTCMDLGFDGGTLLCDWCAFATFACCYNGSCGDEELSCGEECDSDSYGPLLPWDASCQSLGFSGGTLGCSDCTFDTSACF
ncbi:MAG: hypothetical protein RBU30_21905 [Polyangia bacterium]|jgi:hypothetical protein|nr:hypothetical protein [Polyangia bacterium]